MSRPKNFVYPFARCATEKYEMETAALRQELQEEGVIVDDTMRVVSLNHGFQQFYKGQQGKLSEGERDAIATYLATKAPTQCPANDSGDDFNLCVFLRARGHKVQRHCSTWCRRAPYWIDEKPYTRPQFIAFINAIRAELALPLLRCAA